MKSLTFEEVKVPNNVGDIEAAPEEEKPDPRDIQIASLSGENDKLKTLLSQKDKLISVLVRINKSLKNAISIYEHKARLSEAPRVNVLPEKR